MRGRARREGPTPDARSHRPRPHGVGRASFAADVLLMAAAASWESTYWVAKVLADDGGVLGMLSVRMLATAGTLGIVVVLVRRRVRWSSVTLGVLYGLMLSTVFTLETFGIAHTSATNAGLIISLAIVFTPVVEAAFARTRPSRTYLLGGIAAMVGVVLVSMDGHLTAPSLGDWLVLGAAVARAFHVTIVRHTSTGRDVDDLSLTFVQMATCALVFTLLGAAVGRSPVQYVSGLGGGGLLAMGYTVVICTVFPFFIQIWPCVARRRVG